MEKIVSLIELTDAFVSELEQKEYSAQSLKPALRLRRHLLAFADEHGVLHYSEEFGQRFLKAKHPSAFGNSANIINSAREMRRFVKLLDEFFSLGCVGKKSYKVRGDNEGLDDADIALLKGYEKTCEEGNYATETILGKVGFARNFLKHLKSEDVCVSAIGENEIVAFMQTKPKYTRQSLAGMGYSLKKFLQYLHKAQILQSDLSIFVPHIRTPRLARVPSVWKHEDVEKLLSAVDRASAVGKRDYAILLVAAKMGLRTGDIFSLKNEDINWKECKIEITQGKTGQPLSLPLQDDVGWAIIDYLKNGRPHTPHLPIFVSHSSRSIGEPLKPVYGHILMEKYIRQAGITLSAQQKRGLHSLRHTLATRLMETKTNPVIIANVLGWVSPDTIEQYLKTDVENLRLCALNPQEVMINAHCG